MKHPHGLIKKGDWYKMGKMVKYTNIEGNQVDMEVIKTLLDWADKYNTSLKAGKPLDTNSNLEYITELSQEGMNSIVKYIKFEIEEVRNSNWEISERVQKVLSGLVLGLQVKEIEGRWDRGDRYKLIHYIRRTERGVEVKIVDTEMMWKGKEYKEEEYIEYIEGLIEYMRNYTVEWEEPF